jgi:transcription initiation factor TFIID subunit 2
MRFNLKKDVDYVVSNDLNEMSLDDSQRTDYLSQFFMKKSKLIFHFLEAQLSRAFMQKILNSICNFGGDDSYKISNKVGFNNPNTSNNNNPINFISTNKLVTIIRNTTGKDLSSFFNTYACRPGLVVLSCSFTVDQKRNRVVLSIKQRGTSVMRGANERLNGTVLVRTYEIEGVYEHVYALNKNELIFNYHTRSKKKKESEIVMPLGCPAFRPGGKRWIFQVFRQILNLTNS